LEIKVTDTVDMSFGSTAVVSIVITDINEAPAPRDASFNMKQVYGKFQVLGVVEHGDPDTGGGGGGPRPAQPRNKRKPPPGGE
jgi:hypothetical protein